MSDDFLNRIADAAAKNRDIESEKKRNIEEADRRKQEHFARFKKASDTMIAPAYSRVKQAVEKEGYMADFNCDLRDSHAAGHINYNIAAFRFAKDKDAASRGRGLEFSITRNPDLDKIRITRKERREQHDSADETLKSVDISEITEELVLDLLTASIARILEK